jgi:hypothetical protein
MSLYLTKHNAIKTYCGSGGIVPRILLPRHLKEISRQLHAPVALAPEKEPPVPIR